MYMKTAFILIQPLLKLSMVKENKYFLYQMWYTYLKQTRALRNTVNLIFLQEIYFCY